MVDATENAGPAEETGEESRGARRSAALPAREVIARADAEKLHRIHAAPAMGKGGRSFDLAGYRWRPAEAGTDALDAQAVAYRAALCWNLCEGIRTSALADGRLVDEAEAVEDLVAAVERGAPAEELRQLASAVRTAGGRVEAGTDRANGRLHDCAGCGADVAEADEPVVEPPEPSPQARLF